MKHLRLFEEQNRDTKFDVGDHVVCIDNIAAHLLKKGNIYQISSIHINEFSHDAFLHFNEISISSGWSDTRFRKATEEEVAMKKYNL